MTDAEIIEDLKTKLRESQLLLKQRTEAWKTVLATSRKKNHD